MLDVNGDRVARMTDRNSFVRLVAISDVSRRMIVCAAEIATDCSAMHYWSVRDALLECLWLASAGWPNPILGSSLFLHDHIDSRCDRSYRRAFAKQFYVENSALPRTAPAELAAQVRRSHDEPVR